jgi:catechol 2,3-dioxygenase-like lactoylglutathione lyase family enzyme
MPIIERLSRIRLASEDPFGLAAFYVDALGFAGSVDGMEPSLRLGRETIEVRAVAPSARPYPVQVPGWSPLFQHVAIVVSDVAAAYARLKRWPRWTAISLDGPERLPPSSGGVTAFKFRDPEGHPLEFIAFPANGRPARWLEAPDVDLGIDHSAISIADTARSLAFYEGLGLQRNGGSLNTGAEQSRLDAVPEADVEVTSLVSPGHPTPHVELLCYRGTFDRRVPPRHVDDVAATRLVFRVSSMAALRAACARFPEAVVAGIAVAEAGVAAALLRDPDGHLLCLEHHAAAVS